MSDSPVSLNIFVMCCRYWARVFSAAAPGAEIVVAFGQSQASLVNHGNLLARIFEVLLFTEVEKGIHADQLQAAEKLRQLVFALELRNTIELHLAAAAFPSG